MNTELNDITETAITSPATHIPEFVAVHSVRMSLPFSELRWENFEKLCYRLAGKDAEVESPSLYGRPGQAQQGIDIYARKKNLRYNNWQAKCYKKYTKNDLNNACTTFLKGTWVGKTDIFYIAVQCPIDDVHLQDAIEKQAENFHAKNIELKVLGGHDLCTALRAHPDIVLEFFGRECAKAFFGDTVSQDLLEKLDGQEVQKVRSQMLQVYKAAFELIDKIPVNPTTPFSDRHVAPISLLERFSAPDVLLRENFTNHSPENQQTENATLFNEQSVEVSGQVRKEESRQTEQYRRVPILNWLAESDRVAVIGHAGTGKSTVLRCLALDLLSKQKYFTHVAKKWGHHLPLFISFAKWVRLAEKNGGAVSIKTLIRETWQQQLTADLVILIDKAIDEGRVVLFVDGLDEWANEQAARTTLQSMLTIVSAHNIPVLVSARPGGLTKIGGIPDSWAVGKMAPLSKRQQTEIATLWFSRNADQHDDPVQKEEFVSWQTKRFFDELDKGRGLITLAETPLMLLGLIALAVRQLKLPLNKLQALEQLTELLLELHPSSRATAAGDVVPRFSLAASIDIRQDALAALAFQIRTEGGDAGYPINQARSCIKSFLTDPEGYSYTPREASDIASEILAVNSETMGLLVEKGREEVGFVHASLEEYLASVHIHGWPIDRILDFVRANASNFRWRSVFGDLIARNNRRSEAEQIVQVIDEPEVDAVGAFQRRLLLADVVFGGAVISKPTAIRLADQSFDIITGSGWMDERSAHLAAAFEGVYNTTLKDKTSASISSWGVRNTDFLHPFYQSLSAWPPSDELLNILKHGMRDERVQNARAAAHILAQKYGGDSRVEVWLLSFFRGDSELMVVGIALEALVLGWPENDQLPSLIEASSASTHKPLRLSAVFCKVQLSTHDDVDLAELLSFLGLFRGIHYSYREMAGQCLMGWKDNGAVITKCINTLNDKIAWDEAIERDIAQRYLLNCDANNPDICTWLLSELDSQYPFHINLDQNWERVLRFTEVNAEIREKTITTALSEKMEYEAHTLNPVFCAIDDPRVRQHLIDKVRTAEGFTVYWYLSPLLQKRNADDPELDSLIDEILKWPIESRRHIVSLYPMMLDREDCIQALLEILKTDTPLRTDLLISAFAQLDIGSDADITNQLVTHFLSEHDNILSGLQNLLYICPEEARLKKLVLSRLEHTDPPLAAVASAYHHLPEVRSKIARLVGSLSVAIRKQIIDSASSEFDRHGAANLILSKYNDECDVQLKIEGAIKYHQALLPSNSEYQKVVEILKAEATIASPYFEGRNAAAFAGLVAYGAAEEFVPLMRNKKPIPILLGSYNGASNTLLRLIAEQWDDLSKCFNHSFISRLAHLHTEEKFWSLIAPYAAASTSLRQQFITYCDSVTGSLDVPVLQALARELPKSDLLKRQCLSTIEAVNFCNNQGTWLDFQRYFEAAYILREQFPGSGDLSEKLLELQGRTGSHRHHVSAMAIYDPFHPSLDEIASQILKEAGAGWTYVLPIILGTARFESHQLEIFIRKIINRPSHHLWDFQDRINQALKTRIGNDESFTALMGEWLACNPTESEISSFSRILASSGKLDEDTQKLCQRYLNDRYTAAGIPANGFDALSDLTRPVVHSLLDVLAGPIR